MVGRLINVVMRILKADMAEREALALQNAEETCTGLNDGIRFLMETLPEVEMKQQLCLQASFACKEISAAFTRHRKDDQAKLTAELDVRYCLKRLELLGEFETPRDEDVEQTCETIAIHCRDYLIGGLERVGYFGYWLLDTVYSAVECVRGQEERAFAQPCFSDLVSANVVLKSIGHSLAGPAAQAIEAFKGRRTESQGKNAAVDDTSQCGRPSRILGRFDKSLPRGLQPFSSKKALLRFIDDIPCKQCGQTGTMVRSLSLSAAYEQEAPVVEFAVQSTCLKCGGSTLQLIRCQNRRVLHDIISPSMLTGRQCRKVLENLFGLFEFGNTAAFERLCKRAVERVWRYANQIQDEARGAEIAIVSGLYGFQPFVITCSDSILLCFPITTIHLLYNYAVFFARSMHAGPITLESVVSRNFIFGHRQVFLGFWDSLWWEAMDSVSQHAPEYMETYAAKRFREYLQGSALQQKPYKVYEPQMLSGLALDVYLACLAWIILALLTRQSDRMGPHKSTDKPPKYPPFSSVLHEVQLSLREGVADKILGLREQMFTAFDVFLSTVALLEKNGKFHGLWWLQASRVQSAFREEILQFESASALSVALAAETCLGDISNMAPERTPATEKTDFKNFVLALQQSHANSGTEALDSIMDYVMIRPGNPQAWLVIDQIVRSRARSCNVPAVGVLSPASVFPRGVMYKIYSEASVAAWTTVGLLFPEHSQSCDTAAWNLVYAEAWHPGATLDCGESKSTPGERAVAFHRFAARRNEPGWTDACWCHGLISELAEKRLLNSFCLLLPSVTPAEITSTCSDWRAGNDRKEMSLVIDCLTVGGNGSAVAELSGSIRHLPMEAGNNKKTTPTVTVRPSDKMAGIRWSKHMVDCTASHAFDPVGELSAPRKGQECTDDADSLTRRMRGPGGVGEWCYAGELTGHDETVLAVTFSDDGERLASASEDGTMRVWANENRQCVRTFDVSSHIIRMAYCHRGTSIVCAGSGGSIEVRNIEDGRRILRLCDGSEAIGCIAVSADGNHLLSGGGGSDEFGVALWDLTSGRKEREFRGHDAPLLSVGFSEDEKLVVSGSKDGTLRVWRRDDDQSLRVYHTDATWIHKSAGGTRSYTSYWDSVSFSFGAVFALCTAYRNQETPTIEYELWDVARGLRINEMNVPSAFGLSEKTVASFFPLSGRFALSARGSRLIFSDLIETKHSAISSGDHITTIAIAPDQRIAATASFGNDICLWKFDWPS